MTAESETDAVHLFPPCRDDSEPPVEYPAGRFPGATAPTTTEDTRQTSMSILPATEVTSRFYGVPLQRSARVELAPHDDSCDFDELGAWLTAHRGDRLAVDLFSGAGGLSHGLIDAGWTTAVAVDNDERALQTHRANFPGASVGLDLGSSDDRDILVDALKDATIDLVAGGPPCQPFSRAGRSKIRSLVDRAGRDPRDRRKELWAAYMDVVTRLRPRAVIMENVPDMGLSDDFRVLRVMESRFEALGYATDYRIVEAWRYGVPQHRRRLILLARRDIDRFDWPKATSQTTLGDAIGDLPPLEVTPLEAIGAAAMGYRGPATTPFQKLMRRGAGPTLHDHHTRRVRVDDHDVFASMTTTTLYSDIEESKRRYAADTFRDKYKRLDAKGLSRTITAHIAKDGYWYIHPHQHRTITVREAARVQTFPDTFRFAGTRSDAFKQIGNAVPPMLGAAVARAVFPVEGRATIGDLPHWARTRKALDLWVGEQQKDPVAKYYLPGPRISVTQHAVASVLGGAPRDALQSVFGAAYGPLDAERFLAILARAGSSRRRLEGRLEQVVGRPELLADPVNLVDAAGWGKSEAMLLAVMRGVDLIWSGSPAQRVASRMHGQDPSNTLNRQTDGRARIARLVGAGDGAAARMAALRLLGVTTCVSDPLCGSCPLKEFCPSSKP